jgi:hypothetical protein
METVETLFGIMIAVAFCYVTALSITGMMFH